MGADEESKGIQVYWPSHRIVTVEWNIHYEQQIQALENEEDSPIPEFDEAKQTLIVPSKTPSPVSPVLTPLSSSLPVAVSPKLPI